MQFVNYGATSPAQNLACDEALLHCAENGQITECLRVYEIQRPTIVLGIQDEYERAARVDLCRKHDVPVLRRRSGGGTVLLAPGCLLYSLILRRDRADLHSVNRSYKWILTRLCEAVSTPEVTLERAGISDLAWDGRKVGGSAQQRKKDFMLHHGTLLYDVDISLIERFVGEVRAAPEYRQDRSHGDFVANLPLSRPALFRAVRRAFSCQDTSVSLPDDFPQRVEQLIEERYSSDEWTQRR